MDNIKIEIFSGEKDYDLNGFDCGEESLNAFLTNHLKGSMREKFFALMCFARKKADQKC